MMISNIKVNLITPKKGHIAYCAFNLFDCLKVTDVLVWTRRDKETGEIKGIYLLYPKHINRTEPYIYPINNEARIEIEHAVEEEVRKLAPHLLS